MAHPPCCCVSLPYLSLFIVSNIPVILYSGLLSLPELNKECRPQSHEYSKEYGCWVIHYIRSLVKKMRIISICVMRYGAAYSLITQYGEIW